MIKILIVTGSYPPLHCGVGDYSSALAVALAALPDTAVSVLTTGDASSPAIQSDYVQLLHNMPDWSLRSVGALMRALRKLRPDIVHVQYPTQGYGSGGLPWLVPLLARSTGARIVQTWHEGFNRRDLLRFMLMWLVPGRIVVVRSSYSQQMLRPFDALTAMRRPLYINSAATIPRIDASQSCAAETRKHFSIGSGRLILFFGFIHPLKQIEQIFAIANPATDYVAVIGSWEGQERYRDELENIARSSEWNGRAQIIGFVEPRHAAELVSAASALVLPFKRGGGNWNTSILAGILQGTFVLTTSIAGHGYDAATNVYYAPIDDLDEMRAALNDRAGVRRRASNQDAYDWGSIAERHLALYYSLLPAKQGH